MSHQILHGEAVGDGVRVSCELHHSGGESYGIVTLSREGKDGEWQVVKSLQRGIKSEDDVETRFKWFCIDAGIPRPFPRLHYHQGFCWCGQRH